MAVSKSSYDWEQRGLLKPTSRKNPRHLVQLTKNQTKQKTLHMHSSQSSLKSKLSLKQERNSSPVSSRTAQDHEILLDASAETVLP